MTQTLPRRTPSVNPRSRLRRGWRSLAAVLPLITGLILLGACDGNDPSTPGGSRFGQVGVVEMKLETPLALGVGTLEQEIVWTSRGVWRLEERIAYEGAFGDASDRRIQGSLEVSAGAYAQWIAQVNDAPGLDLFIPGLDPTLDPQCPITQSRVTLTIRDQAQSETRVWIRCAPGSLRTLTPAGSGPDANAARVVNAAVLVREYTLGSNFLSDYRGSVPFATLARGTDLPFILTQPVTISDAQAFDEFWSALELGATPQVDFQDEIVFVAAVGVRREAGDSVEVRRVLPVETGTIVEVIERVPGNFCSPAEQEHVPFHVVVAPRVPAPVRFTEIRVERVPCG